MKLKQVFYQESDLVEIINEPIVRTPQDEEPKIIYRKIDYQRKVTCWYSNKLNIGIIQVDLIAQPVYLSGKGYSKKHFSEYPNSAAAIRNAIRLFDEAVAEGLPDRNKTEEEAWEEWRRSQQSNERQIYVPKFVPLDDSF